MIQRIQTVYLLIVAGLFIVLLFVPTAIVQSGGEEYLFDVTGLTSVATDSREALVYPTWSLLAIASIIVLIALATVFMYRRRMVQIRLCIYNALLIIGFCVLYGFFAWKFSRLPELPDMHLNMRIWAALPIVALIINYLAIRNIGADETLVRSLERLR